MPPKNTSELNNESNLQTLANELNLTSQETENFKKLSKEQQEKLNEEKHAELTALNIKLQKIVDEAISTGDPEKHVEAKKLDEYIKKGISDLTEMYSINEIIPNNEVADFIVNKLEQLLKEGASKDYIAQSLTGVGTPESMAMRERLIKGGTS